jgi:hypothetical protein
MLKTFLRTHIFPLLKSGSFILLALPASTNYQLDAYNFGSGGVGSSSSTNYSLEGSTGEISGQTGGDNYSLGAGLLFAQQANVPSIASFTNTDSYYDKLHFVLDPADNPSDGTFAVAISSDNFVTTEYVQSDGTVGSALGVEDYQTYSAWGSASGSLIIGLDEDTTYEIKAKASAGDFTETGYGPAASAATVASSFYFSVYTDTQDTPPFVVAFNDLDPNTIMDSPELIWTEFGTNGASGANVFIVDTNNGLFSNKTSYLIPSLTGNLTSLDEGFGIQGTSTTQTAGGPVTIQAPYDNVDENVGITDTTFRSLFSSDTPVSQGKGSFLIKAKSATLTPAASDYTDTFTLVGSGNF